MHWVFGKTNLSKPRFIYENRKKVFVRFSHIKFAKNKLFFCINVSPLYYYHLFLYSVRVHGKDRLKRKGAGKHRSDVIDKGSLFLWFKFRYLNPNMRGGYVKLIYIANIFHRLKDGRINKRAGNERKLYQCWAIFIYRCIGDGNYNLDFCTTLSPLCVGWLQKSFLWRVVPVRSDKEQNSIGWLGSCHCGLPP